jgi:formiminoglutamase
LVPPEVWARLNTEGRKLRDTDWHVGRLYDGLLPGITTVRATFHRYVIDANRPPDGASLYPGKATTDLVPLTDFDGAPIWEEAPDGAEVARRCVAFHVPYHAALAAEMERVRNRHGVAILYDAHSIRSHIPRLFEGVLPDLNVGTNGGTTCDVRIERTVADLVAASPFTHVVNGRFRGGWTTRHYGRPVEGWHALQMEIAQRAYLTTEALPWTYNPARAAVLRDRLEAILTTLANLAPTFGGV